jgi:thioredoxin 1
MADDELEAIRAKKLAELQAFVQGEAQKKDVKPFTFTDTSFEADTRREGVVLVDMWAVWCGPCLQLAPAIEQIAKEYAGKVRVGKLNVDENPVTPSRFGVDAIPTMLVFRDGKLVDQIVGAVSKQEIEGVLNRWI